MSGHRSYQPMVHQQNKHAVCRNKALRRYFEPRSVLLSNQFTEDAYLLHVVFTIVAFLADNEMQLQLS